MTSRSVFDVVEPVSLASDSSRRRAKRSALCSTVAVLLVATPHDNLAWAAGIKAAMIKTATGTAVAPHVAIRTRQLFAAALFDPATCDGASTDLSGPRATGMTLANTPIRELGGLLAETYEVPSEPEQIQGRPVKIQATPVQIQATPVQIQAKPIQMQAKPIQMQAKPIQIPVKPIQMQAKPIQMQAKPIQMQAKPIQIQAKPIQMQAKPIQMQAKPIQMQAKPIQMQAKPIQIQAKPIQIQAKPIQIQAKISQTTLAVPPARTHLRSAMFGNFDMLRGPMPSGSAVEQTAAYGSTIAVERQLEPKHLGAAAINSVPSADRTITAVSRSADNAFAAYGATLTPFIARKRAGLQSVEEASKAWDFANARGADAKGKS